MIKIENLTLKYDAITAVSDLNCEIFNGDSVALLGANGAGKSSLLNALVGLIQPIAGEIEIDGLKVESGNLSKIRTLVGIIFQRADDQLFCENVRADISFGLKNMSLSTAEVDSRVEEVSARLGIGHLLERSCQRLSAGEKKLAALAGVLAMRPKVLLFDESDAMLDPRAKRELADVVNSLDETKIIATHDLDFAKKTCSKTLLLKNSKQVKYAQSSEIFSDENLLFDCGLA